MLVRRLQQQRTQYMINLPADVCQSFGWKKGDLIKFEIPAKGVLQLSKVEIMRVPPKENLPEEAPPGVHAGTIKPQKIPYVEDQRSNKPSDKIKFFK